MSELKGLKLKPQDFEINAQGQVVIKNEKVAALLKEHAVVTAQGKASPSAPSTSVAVILLPGVG